MPPFSTQSSVRSRCSLLKGCIPWPAEFAATYRAKGYWRGETLGAHLRRWAAERPSAVAVIAGEEQLTYEDFNGHADTLAMHLGQLRLRNRDRILVQLTNSPRFFILIFACFRIGVIPILTLPAHRESEMAHFASLSRASAYVVPANDRFDYVSLARGVRQRVPSIRHLIVDGDDERELFSLPRLMKPSSSKAIEDQSTASDVALFLLSGGTTGYPKLIPRTHNDYSYNFRRSSEIAGFDESTRYLAVLPVSHNFPLGSPGALGVFERGGTVVLSNDPSSQGAFKLIERQRITHTSVVPTIALRWIESAETRRTDLSSLRVLQVGGARLAEEVARKVRPVLGCRLQQVFGMAEGLLNYTQLDDDEETIVSSQGLPICPDDELRFVNEEGEEVPSGSPGELLVRGPYTIRGYYQAPEHNARAFTPDGFYRSGDVVRRLPTGHLVVEGRAKDMINRGGEKISAVDVENHLLAHPRIRDAAVVAIPDREFGERVCVFIITRDGAPLGLPEIGAFLSTRQVAKFMYPERVELVDAFPLTNVGKVDKKSLRQIAAKISLDREQTE
ncbi:MAG: 2,3-dihydroxybenzoate-AMP ligase [Acidobacteria bacterium]|nr:MAG: 2,3-dihydroxybenzoate-AMP ligase [Acidobacteriota bacterium]